MSHSTLWNVYNTKVTFHSEYQNGHGSAPSVWGYICKNILGEDENWWLFNSGENALHLWDVYKNREVHPAVRFALLWTFDYGVVTIKNIGRAITYCEEVANITHRSEYVNHWYDFSIALRNIKRKHHRSLIGIGLGCTSVNDPYEYVKRKDMKLFGVIETLDEYLDSSITKYEY